MISANEYQYTVSIRDQKSLVFVVDMKRRKVLSKNGTAFGEFEIFNKGSKKRSRSRSTPRSSKAGGAKDSIKIPLTRNVEDIEKNVEKNVTNEGRNWKILGGVMIAAITFCVFFSVWQWSYYANFDNYIKLQGVKNEGAQLENERLVAEMNLVKERKFERGSRYT